MVFYAITASIFSIDRGLFLRPLSMYLGSKFSELESAKGAEVTVFPNKEAAKSYAQKEQEKDQKHAVGILKIKILDMALQDDLAKKNDRKWS